MRLALHLAILAPALVAGPAALGGELVKPTIDFNDMRVVVSYISTVELANLQHKYGVYGDQRDILQQDYRHGFSILKKNRETGALTCEIYLPSAKQPREVDDEATLSLGHELLHCMRGNYHRP
jgi:hypothetical protein